MRQKPGIELDGPHAADGLGHPIPIRLLENTAYRVVPNLCLQRHGGGLAATPFRFRPATSVLQPGGTGPKEVDLSAVDLDDISLDDGCKTFECVECTQR